MLQRLSVISSVEISRLNTTAAKQMYSNRLRRVLKVDRCRVATLEELEALTGLVPGSVPPFGEPILPFPLYVDESVLANDRIAFNAGSLTDSIIMKTSDWRNAVDIKAVVKVARE